MRFKLLVMLFTMISKLEANKKFVLTGGPGVGKITVLSVLEKWGYPCIQEVYGLLYAQAKEQDSLTAFFANPVNLYARILQEQITLEQALPKIGCAFLDRSTIDIAAFARYFKVPLAAQFLQEIARQYATIFFLDPLPESLYVQCHERKETYKESLYVHDLIKEVYMHCGYQIVVVPFDTIENRTEYILSYVKDRA